MTTNRRHALLATAALLFLRPAVGNTGFRTITWDELVPKDWDPAALMSKGANPATVQEGSAREQELMREMRAVFDNAPTRADMHGVKVRLPGYVVPLDSQGGGVREFLLVPYFGACIHVPPPPANQIVHVKLPAPKPMRTMDAVWASGTLSAQRSESMMGVSGYTLQGAVQLEPYVRR